MHVEDGTDTERQYGSNMMPPAQHIGMFNIPQSELAERSPQINLHENLNYKHVTGMNAT